jgi:hypothetical protein
MKIEKIVPSDRKNKKLKAIFSDGKEINFGLKSSLTYIEGASKKKRDAFLKRHISNPLEKPLIEKNIPSPALLSYALLWNTPSLQKNLQILNKKF